MTNPQPTKTTEWCSTGTKVEPSSGIKATGWVNQERVPFDWLNWIFKTIEGWLVYVKNLTAANITNDSSITGTTIKDALNTLRVASGVQNDSSVTGTTIKDALNTLLSTVSSGTCSVKVTTDDLTVEQTGTLKWARSGNIIALKLPYLQGTSNSAGFRIRAVDVAGFPTAIIPPTDYANCSITQVKNNGGFSWGLVRIPISRTDPIQCYFEASGLFTNSGTKGITDFDISYSLS